MRKLATLFCFALLAACGENSGLENEEPGNILDNLTYAVDTVMIDPNEEFLFLQWGLNASAVTKDRKLFFNFNPKNQELELIDLESQRLQRKVSMDREGPLGTGDAQVLQLDNEGKLYMIGLWELRIFNPSLDSMTLIKLTPEILKGLESEDMVGPEGLVTTDGKFFISTYYSKGRSNAGLLVISLDDLSLEKYPYDLGDRLNPFQIKMYEEGKLKMSTMERIFLEEVGQKIVISSTHFNEAYVLDLAKDSLLLKSHHSQITSDQAEKPENSNVESFEELEAVMMESGKQVSFGPYIFDEEGARIWRFSKELESEREGKSVYRNVLTLFDSELNQLGEAKVNSFLVGPNFFKDGKLWSYMNVEDELGFAVFEFKF